MAAAGPSLSAVIPVLNEAEAIPRLVRRLRTAAVDEVIVVDGGSCDGTRERAAAAGARVVLAAPGRGRQLEAGARAAQGEALWFLHADVSPPPRAGQLIRAALRGSRIAAGSFTIQFAGPGRAARFFTWLYPRLALFGLRYGDASLFVRRDAYFEVGGFRPYPIFEDLDLIRRLQRRGPWHTLPEPLIASSRRFDRHPVLTCALWGSLQLLYWLGIPPRWLGRLYRPVRRLHGKSEAPTPRDARTPANARRRLHGMRSRP